MEYNNTLRNGILEAYSGIIQGLGPQKASQYLRNEVPFIIEFVSSIGGWLSVDRICVHMALLELEVEGR